MDTYSDIRPYNDAEVRPVLDGLLGNSEFLGALCRMRFPRVARPLGWLLEPVVAGVLRRQLRDVSDVASMQQVVKGYMDRMIEQTTSGFTVSGIEQLAAESPYLFMSNHRDIALDPAFINYSLYRSGHDTVRIAIGDNLLTKDYASDLMRLNKSFIVRRSARGPRQMLAAYKQLSSYVRMSLAQEKVPVWIAQREGRAKDGFDQTDATIIKMLAMSQVKAEESFADFIRLLRIVPVAISYQYDPLDEAKALELYTKEHSGSYAKGEQEDVLSIARGITGQKGDVHVAYGSPLQEECKDANDVAALIDRQVIGNYVLHPSNFFAYEQLYGSFPTGLCGGEQRAFDPARYRASGVEFAARLTAMPEHLRPYVLNMYANCIVRKQEMGFLAAAQGSGTETAVGSSL
jgi:hypothetical protein